MFGFIKENSDKVFLLGIAFIIIGTAVFFGATPRGQKSNDPGEAWLLAVPLVALGASLLFFYWCLQR